MAMRPVPSPTTVHTVTPLPRHLLRQVGHDGYLESWGLGVALLVVAGIVLATFVALAVLRRHRGRPLVPRVPRWLVLSGEATTVLALALVGVLVMVNNYVGYVPTLHALFSTPGTATVHVDGTRQRDGSHVIRIHIHDAADGVKTGTAYVYVPPGYYAPANAHRRYPTIYLLHGYPGRPQDWFTAGDVQLTMDLLIREGYVGPMIVVSPSASTGYLDDDECLNAPGHFALEDYLAVKVVARIDHQFRTDRDRAHRAIGGMSSGGFCALNIGLHHLHRFSVILASEPYGDPGLNPLHRALDGNWALWRANSPSFYIPLWHFEPRVATFLDSGGFDMHTTTNALRLARQFAARGQEASYRPAPRVHHNWREARMALPYSLIFAWQHFGHMPDGGSDAADAAQFQAVLAYARTLPPPSIATATAASSPTATSPVSPPSGPSPSASSDRPPATPTRSRSPMTSPTESRPT